MKKLYSLLFIVFSTVAFAQTFYSENMGTTATGNPVVTSYTGWQNVAPIVYSGTASARTSLPSSGYNGVSGSVNVFIGATTGVGQYFQIEGLNTSAYQTADLQLSFGYTKSSATGDPLLIEKSTNGTTWTALTYTDNTTTSWNLVTIAGGQIPSTTNLYLRFTNTTTATTNAPNFRLDDIKLSNVSASCTLTLGAVTTACLASTINLDTYEVTIPYTGGGNATYVVTPNSGTVSGGDNPSTVAAGNIIVTGVTEGTSFSITITGGTCNLSVTGSSPECKPINTLPYAESFPYAIDSSLNDTQKWTGANSGDNVTIAAGSLNYAGFTSTGNSITFSGAGAESFTPFTATTSGAIYASFIMNVTDMANITGDPSVTYFAGLSDGSTGGYNARIFLSRVGTQYQLGFDTASTTTNYDATMRNVGDIVFVVMGYDFTSNTYKAWFNPNLGTFTDASPATLTVTPTTAPTTFGGFIIRQDSNTTTPTIIMDELRVATTTSGLLSVSQNAIAGLKVYPNPVSNGKLFIETAANAERTVAIYDLLGKNVLNTTTSNSEVNVASLNAGVYIVKITEEGNTTSRKLVIR
jgi:hypothetical protein